MTPFFNSHHAFRAHDERAGRAFDVARDAHRDVVDAETDGVGEGQLHLRVLRMRTENAQVRDQAAAGADQGDHLFRGVVAVLIERLMA